MKTLLLLTLSGCAFAQSNDFFLMTGADVVRPGSAIKSNYNIGYGRVIPALRQYTPLLDEVTVSYTYEAGAHTEAVGVMRNIDLPKTKRCSVYSLVELGMTSFTAKPTQNRLYSGYGGGLSIHTKSGNIWIQELVNKIATVPAYTTTSIGWVKNF